MSAAPVGVSDRPHQCVDQHLGVVGMLPSHDDRVLAAGDRRSARCSTPCTSRSTSGRASCALRVGGGDPVTLLATLSRGVGGDWR